MKLRCSPALAFTIGQAFATEVGGPTGIKNATAPIVRRGEITIHYVTVGLIEHEFGPNSIIAKEGDIVSFQFYPLNHSIIQAAYGYPCIPIEAVDSAHSQFYSEFFPVNTPSDSFPTWNLTINSTEPIFYYCGAPGSCIEFGMVGAINANSSTSLAKQIKLAKEADYMLLPGQQFPSEKVQASLSELAHSATRVSNWTASMTSAPLAGDDNSSGLSPGAVSGIAVGASVAALLVAALFLLMRRTRKLKQKLELKATAANVLHTAEQTGNTAATHQRVYFDRAPTNSQLPPYPTNHHVNRPDSSKLDHIEGWAVQNAENSTMTPFSIYGAGRQSPDFHQQSHYQEATNLHPGSYLNTQAAELEATRPKPSEERV